MSNADHPPTLVDLAALDEATPSPWTVGYGVEIRGYGLSDRDVFVVETDCDNVKFLNEDEARFAAAAKGFAPHLLAALRALPRWDHDSYLNATGGHYSDEWIMVSDLRALLGEKA